MFAFLYVHYHATECRDPIGTNIYGYLHHPPWERHVRTIGSQLITGLALSLIMDWIIAWFVSVHRIRSIVMIGIAQVMNQGQYCSIFKSLFRWRCYTYESLLLFYYFLCIYCMPCVLISARSKLIYESTTYCNLICELPVQPNSGPK